MQRIQNLIAGKMSDPKQGNYLRNIQPATGRVYSEIPDSDAEDVHLAVEKAKAAFPEWSQTTLEERSSIMLEIAAGIKEELENLAKAESADNGKPVKLAQKVDIPRAVDNFEFYAKAITQFSSESHESVGKNSLNFTLRKPLGVVGCISPWNLPLYLFTWKIAPALAAGNCVVAKPSEVTPMTAYLLSKIVAKSRLPKGVLNLVHGSGPKTGQAIIEHRDVKAISFTGGTTTGAQIAKTAAPMFKKLSLELGGKNPNLIFADCDYDKMLNTTLKSSFANQGQICLCGSRIFVEESIYEKFKKDFLNRVEQMKVGDPDDAKNSLGAVVSKNHMNKILKHIEDAPQQGAKILTGGNRVHPEGFEEGYYIEPTVIEVENNQCSINQEEVFGPVVTLMPFKSDDEALKLANDSAYGLSATVWTQNVNRCMRFGHELESGIIWINTWLNRDLRTPFGGMKSSGVGREGGMEALRFFTEPKNVCIEWE